MAQELQTVEVTVAAIQEIYGAVSTAARKVISTA